MRRRHCLSCEGADLRPVIDLGMHPMADRFVPLELTGEGEKIYPLGCDLCPNCGHIQAWTITDPMERYVEFEYSYVSGHSKTSRDHWVAFEKDVSEQVLLPHSARVLEVGSNDGFLTAQFQKSGHQVLGVDPSPVMSRLAQERGVPTLESLFSTKQVDLIRQRLGGPPDLIIANNVFNHADLLRDFAGAVQQLLAPRGTFVFQVPWWRASFLESKIDQVYHEHVNYFTVRSVTNLFRSLGMAVNFVQEVDYHGSSLRVFVNHREGELSHLSGARVVQEFIQAEEESGVFQEAAYQAMMERVRRRRDEFLLEVYALRSKGIPIVCVGAAAKGNTFLNYYNLDASVIDCVTDASPTKVGKFTPRTRIPIKSDEALRDFPEVYAIILSWNIAAALKPILARYNPNIQFLNPYPA